MQQRKKLRPSKRRYRKPALERRRRLSDVTEGDVIFVTGGRVT